MSDLRVFRTPTIAMARLLPIRTAPRVDAVNDLDSGKRQPNVYNFRSVARSDGRRPEVNI